MRWLLVLVLILAGCASGERDAGKVWGSGRIDGDEIEVAPKYPGKVVKLLVGEGDRVKRGQPVAYMDSRELREQVNQAQAAVKMARFQVEAARKAYLMTKREVELQVEAARKRIEAAESTLGKAKAVLDKLKKDYARYKRLYQKRVVAKSRFEEVERALKVAEMEYRASLSMLSEAKVALKLAESRRFLVEVKERKLKEAQAELERRKALLRELEVRLDEMVIRAPADGVIIEKVADVGEVLASGSPIFIMVDPARLYLKMFVSEKDVGKIALGMPGDIYVDAFPGKPFPARVCYVAQRAEFTPKEVETREERVHHVFAVKLCPLDNSKGLLKLGMPADGVIHVR